MANISWGQVSRAFDGTLKIPWSTLARVMGGEESAAFQAFCRAYDAHIAEKLAASSAAEAEKEEEKRQ